ncbi:hypothetical protein vBCtySFA88_00053 [Clostridium phage vB_CtyS-FA88]|nr:hypothetical protein vBCtySFA88_00053 [Clostridium phage vB_CtyS-FA88]
MEIKIKTAVLKKITAIAEKGVGADKNQPITSYLHLYTKEGIFYIDSTDGYRFLTVSSKLAECTDGSCIVLAEPFIKLVNKTTKEDVKLNLLDTLLVFKGNGTYKIPILDEEFLSYEFNAGTKEEINIDKIKNVIAIGKNSIAPDDESFGALRGYLFGDKVVATDSIKMCLVNTKLVEKPMLVNQSMARLINVIPEEKGTLQYAEGKILIETETVKLFGAALNEIDQYPDLSVVLDNEFSSNCLLNKNVMLDILDRLDIFVSPYDKNAVKLQFGKDGIVITEVNGDGIEKISYSGSTDFKEFEIPLDITMLKDIINAVQADTFRLYYGNDDLIKIKDKDTVELLCRWDDSDE